jgi:hypothetical protein
MIEIYRNRLPWYAGKYSRFKRRTHFQTLTLINYLGKIARKIKVARKFPAAKISKTPTTSK